MRTLSRSLSVSLVAFIVFFLSFSETSFAVPYLIDGTIKAETIQTTSRDEVREMPL